MQNIVSSLCLIVVSGFFLTQTFQIRDPGFDPLGTTFLPKLALYTILFLSVLMLAKEVLTRYLAGRQAAAEGITAAAAGTGGAQDDGARLSMVSLAVVGLLAIYIAVLNAQIASFEIVTPFYIFLTGLVTIRRFDRSLIMLAVVSVVLPVLIAYVFKNFFYVNLP